VLISQDVKFVTAIYDIGRNNKDGRSIDDYLKWLRKTLVLFPNTYVFYEDDHIKNHFDKAVSGGIWVKLPFVKFELADYGTKIADICKIMSLRSNDLTFQLPNYAILQFQKFNFLERLAFQFKKTQGFFWIDAGISRFIPDSNFPKLSLIGKQLLNSKKYKSSFFEVDIKNNLKLFGGLKSAKVGTCRRIFSGTSFYLINSDTSKYASSIFQLSLDWINDHKWDNEQVALNNLFKSKSISPNILLQKKQTGTVARQYLNLEKTFMINSGSLIYKLLQE
jgi:hypothetical protein